MSSPHVSRRELFIAQLPKNSAAVIGGGSEVRRNSDVHHRFRQPSDLLYLTGFTEPEALAVFTPGKDKRFTLFVRPRDKEREIWEGRRAGVEGAVARHGADQAFPIAELSKRLPELLDGCDEVLLDMGDDSRLDRLVLQSISSLRQGERRGQRAPQRVVQLRTVLHEQRLIKDDEALRCLRCAVAITAEAHLLAARAARGGTREYEVEALIDYTFRRRGGHPGYGTIVGGGANATILHYIECADELRQGDLLLIDAGCEYHGFTADVTRAYPIGPAAGQPGRAAFSPTQRRVYDVVLRAQLAGIDKARPGETIETIHDRCTQVLTEGMVELGLLSGEPKALIEKGEHKKFYMHRTSHWLGMDVHDVGEYFPSGTPRRLVPGMVLTIEPGLYIADEEAYPAQYRGIGVRIEDDLLITEQGHEVLTRAIPKQPADLEALWSD